ncbi:alpha/beta hydrolase [Roseospira marina]|uniref:Alpha/beta hydrolase n=1 Tax=Roseospira marina TaxID=140057 RepID=A0A5M6IEF0_9PROT|nr:alpha/beta hydrolase [Roseospira marina]KAA5606624.1 alpha/beta hydrolase [Roseospira marina]MBB4313973.1 pimeloyl-ACP methyl ester carboxylesterase [Roseospira marina]MBB5087135.1 pimeloyl-ACP methyl ester carboxylesterase [Roseospira marina]
MRDPSFVVEDTAVAVDGRRLSVRRVTPSTVAPGAPTLVFLHEGLGSIGLWKDVPEALCRATGLPAVVYDRLGHGGSDPLRAWPRPVGYLEHEAEHVLPRVLDALGLDRIVLVGHSDGGSIALLYAALRPAGLLGAVTEAAHVFVEPVTLAGIRAARTAFLRGDLRAKLARWHGRNTEGVFWGWNATWLTAPFPGWCMTDRLPSIRCPLLVIQGEADEYGTIAQVEAIVVGVCGPVTPFMVPDCGHVPHHQARAPVLAAMADTVGRWTGTADARRAP